MISFHSSTVISPTLIGREMQLALLTDLLVQASSGHGCSALISGEAGIGKSRLVIEITARAALRGARVVCGRCFEHDRNLPYAPLIDLLRAFCAGLSSHELTPALGSTAAELVKIFPELSAALPNLAPTPILDREQEKRRLFQAISRFIQQLALAGQPLLLVLEDLHWCDDTSLEWLLHLARELKTQPMLVLLTYRSDEMCPTLNQLLGALDRISYVGEVVLPRLNRADVEMMLRTIFTLPSAPRADFVDALYALTDGNPFFIEEVLKALIAAGDIYREGGEWTRKPLRELQIPRTVQVAVQQRTHRLRDATRQLLTIAAVAGQRFDFALLQAVTQESERELLQQIKDLVAAQLVVEESDETFAFRHALTRQAIYSALLARERKALHRAVAEALERCYADTLHSHAAELAYHCYEAGRWTQALEWAMRAGDNAARLYAHAEALSQYTRARDCAEKLGQLSQVATVDHAIGAIHEARGEFPQALAAYTRTLHATADPARRGVVKAKIGAAYVNLADERGLAYLHQALDELDPATQTAEAAAATLWLGRYYHLRAQYTQALAYLERARALIEPLDDASILRLFYGSMAIVLMYSARFEASMAWARRGIALGEAKHDDRAVFLGYLYLAETSEYLGRWQDTRALANHGRQFARRSGWHNMEVWIELERLVVAYYQGDLAAALELARDCVASATELDERRAVLHTNKLLILVETALGHEEAACRLGEQAVRDVDQVVGVGIRCWVRLALAGLYMQREEYPRATALYEQCANMLAGAENRVLQMELGAPMAEAYGAQGQLSKATSTIAETLELTRASGARHYEAVAWRVHGQILAAQGLHEDAARAFDQALALCEELGSQLELAHVLYQRGLLYQALGGADIARADWARACALAEQMGARALLWRARGALGQLALARQHPSEAEHEFAAARAIVEQLAAGMHDGSFRENLRQRAAALVPAEPLVVSRRAVKAEFGGLTERERAVATLIAQGHSNRAIAEQLVVSERTITTHISNIFAKLGFSSRAQVARWASEKGVAGHRPD